MTLDGRLLEVLAEPTADRFDILEAE